MTPLKNVRDPENTRVFEMLVTSISFPPEGFLNKHLSQDQRDFLKKLADTLEAVYRETYNREGGTGKLKMGMERYNSY